MIVRLSAASLAAAFCGLAAVAVQAAPAPDPCPVVARADAAKALGAPVTSLKPAAIGPSRSCAFHGAKPFQSLVVTTFRWDSPADARARFADLVRQTASAYAEKPVKLAGVGDEAVTVDSIVYTRKGTAGYVFNVFGQRTPALTARAVALAKATMPRVR